MSNSNGSDDTFGARLIEARERRGLNQTELGKLANLQPAAIGHFERNRRKPSFANIRALSKALDVTADYLLGRSPSMEGASTAFRGQENLSKDDREYIQMTIDAMNQRKVGQGGE